MNKYPRMGALHPEVHELDELLELGAYTFYDRIANEGLTAWIARNRSPVIGPIDIERSARHLGVELVIDNEMEPFGRTEGLIEGSSELAIKINEEANSVMGEGIATTFGHEVGHVYLEHNLEIDIPHSLVPLDFETMDPIKTEEMRRRIEIFAKVEGFCDVFGRNYAFPVSELANTARVDEAEISRLIEVYDISFVDAVEQLMKAELLPGKVKVKSLTKYGPEGLRMGVDVICLGCRYSPGSCNTEASETLDFSDEFYLGSYPSCRNSRTAFIP